VGGTVIAGRCPQNGTQQEAGTQVAVRECRWCRLAVAVVFQRQAEALPEVQCS